MPGSRQIIVPIDETCPCHTCVAHSRAYLRHLVQVKEFSAHRLLTIHNLRYTFDLVAGAREAIETSTFSDYALGVATARSNGSP